MEDLDIIRHDMQPGLQPGRWPGCRARSTAGLPAENRGRAARESRPGQTGLHIMSYDIQIFHVLVTPG